MKPQRRTGNLECRVIENSIWMKRLLLAAALVLAALPAAASAATPRHTVDLASGRFEGHTILGRTPSQVTAVLGKPSAAHGSTMRYVLDWGSGAKLRYTVIFSKRGTSERAVLIGLETGTYVDPRLGDLLAWRPLAFQKAMRSRYADLYRLGKPLEEKPGVSIGEFTPRDGLLHVSFGTHATLGSFLTIWTP
jgi:hypothetical protein